MVQEKTQKMRTCCQSTQRKLQNKYKHLSFFICNKCNTSHIKKEKEEVDENEINKRDK